MAKTNTLKATSNAEIISYFLNQNPEIREEIGLPVQGQSTIEIGKLIVDNARYRNAFINTVNLIGLTIIKSMAIIYRQRTFTFWTTNQRYYS